VRDDLTAAQGANLLYQQVPATGKISSERHSTKVFDKQAPPLPNIAKLLARRVLDEFDRPDGNPFSHHCPPHYLCQLSLAWRSRDTDEGLPVLGVTSAMEHLHWRSFRNCGTLAGRSLNRATGTA
jgi:hypothetical protein